MPENQALSLPLPIRLVLCALLLCLTVPAWCAWAGDNIQPGRWTPEGIEALLSRAKTETGAGEQIALISEAFLGTPYVEHSLVGDARTAEVLVVKLDGLDCLTYLDTVEALRRAGSWQDFIAQLRAVRYRDAQVAFAARNHFFADWADSNAALLEDVTAEVAGSALKTADKLLNRREDGGLYLEGYPVRSRRISYLPADALAGEPLQRLKTGDYVGIFTPKAGLDVSHTGIIIRREGKVFLRHASSKAALRRVTEDELPSYLKSTQGLVVLRPK